MHAAVDMEQARRHRRPGGAHPRHQGKALGRNAAERLVAQPVDLAQMQPARRQRLARADDHPPAGRVEMDHIERLADRDADAAALADRVVDDALVAAEHAPVDMDDVARLAGAGLQPLDHLGIVALRHEADVLAVVLVGDRQAQLARRRAGLGLGHGCRAGKRR